MATVDAGTAQGKRPSEELRFDGFISYSHAADGLLAPRLQAGLQQFAKPWWKRRTMRLFRDESSLSANPHLWSSITEALDASAWFILLLSPQAASSKWVNDEIEYWLEHKDPGQVIPVLTEGEFNWTSTGLSGDAVPPALESVFSDEPRWVDLRFARGEEQLDLNNPAFSSAVADIASAIRGIPKDELSSEEVRQHRRTRRVAIGAAVALLTLTTVATAVGIYAFDQRGQANDNAALATARELSAASQGVADDDAELGILLALEAVDVTEDTGLETPPEALSALWHSVTRDRVDLTIQGAGNLYSAFSPDGSLLATDLWDDLDDDVSENPGDVVLWDPETGSEVGRLDGPEVDDFDNGTVNGIQYTADGTLLLVSRFYDPQATSIDQVSAVDVYDVASRELVASLIGPPDNYGRLTVSASGLVMAYARESKRSYIWDLDSPEESPAVVDASLFYFLADDDLVLGIEEVENEESETQWFLFALDWRTGDRPWTHELPIAPDRVLVVDPDSSRVALADFNRAVAILDLTSGEVLLESSAYPDPQEMRWSPDGSALAISGNDADVTIIDPTSGRVTLVLSGPDASIFSTAWHPNGDRLATVEHENRETRIWDVSTLGANRTGQMAVDGAGPFYVIPTGGLVRSVIGSHLEVLDAEGAPRATFDYVPLFPVLGVASGNGRFVAGTYGDGRGSVIETDTGDETDLGCLSPRALSWDGSLVAADGSACDDGTPSGVFEVESGEAVINLGDQTLGLASFTTGPTFDGREYVALNIADFAVIANAVPARVEVWVSSPAEKLGSVEQSALGTNLFIHARFSSDGRYLGIGTSGPAAVVVDVQRLIGGASPSDYVVFNQEVHSGNAPFAHPTSDGILATGGFEAFFRLWDIATGARLMQVDVRDSNTSYPAHGLSGDESTYYYNQVGSIGAMPMDFDEMVDLARSSVTRSFTEDECREYLHTDGCE